MWMYASSSTLPTSVARGKAAAACASHAATESTGPRARVSFHAIDAIGSMSPCVARSDFRSAASHGGAPRERTTNCAETGLCGPTLGSCIQLVRIERRRSIYSGAEMMPSARNGVSAEAEADDAAGATAADIAADRSQQRPPDSQL